MFFPNVSSDVGAFNQGCYAKRHIFLIFDQCINKSYRPCITISTWSGVFICNTLGLITNKYVYKNPTKTQHFPYGKSAMPPKQVNEVMQKDTFF